MSEDEIPPEVRKEMSMGEDPRDYIPIAAFGKLAAEIDPNKDNRWDLTIDRFGWIEDDQGSIVYSEIDQKPINGKNNYGLLLLEQTGKDSPRSIYLTELDTAQRGPIIDFLRDFAPRFNADDKQQFVRNIISNSEEFSNMDPKEISYFLVEQVISLLPVLDQEEIDYRLEDYEWGKDEQVRSLISLGLSRLPADRHSEYLKNIGEYITTTDDPFGKNFSFIATNIANTAMDMLDGYEYREKVLKNRDLAKNYPVEDKITNPISSMSQLSDRLDEQKVDRMPSGFRSSTHKSAYMVATNDIVGGSGIERWSKISTSSGRGLELVYRFANSYQQGAELDNREPITLKDIEGKYYVVDGRHRVAALKALGVDRVPALVFE